MVSVYTLVVQENAQLDFRISVICPRYFWELFLLAPLFFSAGAIASGAGSVLSITVSVFSTSVVSSVVSTVSTSVTVVVSSVSVVSESPCSVYASFSVSVVSGAVGFSSVSAPS
jgi:hypothetical protein